MRATHQSKRGHFVHADIILNVLDRTMAENEPAAG